MGKGTVEIKNLLGTEKLVFNLPEKPEVYLLAGPNGVGKSTLLACLAKIGREEALRKAFPPNNGAKRIDTYRNARIHYRSSRGEVVYRRALTRWNPETNNNKKVFDGFGFPEVIHAQVSPYRYTAHDDDMVEGETIRLSAFSSFLEESLCDMFEREDFRNIEVLRNKAGRRWFKHFYICKALDGSYYSEKVFSTGELAALRLLGYLNRDIKEGALVLIDEFDMGLHPKAQSKLVGILKELAHQKRLTIILATHSASLISKTPSRNILFLEKETGGETRVVNPCYPSRAMRTIDIYRSALRDFLFLVEDDMAKKCLEVLLRLARNEDPDLYEASCYIVPIGGYLETVQFAQDIEREVPTSLTLKAILDGDAFDDEALKYLEEIAPANWTTEQKKEYRSAKDWQELRIRLVKEGLIGNLGFTPEVKLTEIMERAQPQNEIEGRARAKFSRSLSDIVSSRDYKKYCASLSEEGTSSYKQKYDYVVDKLAPKNTLERKEQVALDLVEVLLPAMNPSDVREIVGKILWRKKK